MKRLLVTLIALTLIGSPVMAGSNFERVSHSLAFGALGYLMGTAIWGASAKGGTPGKINLGGSEVSLPLGGVGLGIMSGALFYLAWNYMRPETDNVEMWSQALSMQVGIQLGLWF